MITRPPRTEAAAKPSGRVPVDLVATGLRVAYERDVEILRGVEITAAARRISLVIGPNGAGKSTFLKAVAGLAPVTGGLVTLGGVDITRWRPRDLLAHGVALVPQNGTLFPAMTVRENLQMGGWLRRREKAWLGESIEAVINRFNLPRHLVDRRAGDLSGGQQKLVEIMRSMVMTPTTLLLDEPTAGLSPKMASQVYEQIAALPGDLGVTVLLVDQNVRSSLAISDDVYVLAMGLNNDRGTARDITERLGEITAGWLRQGVSGAVKS